LESITTDLSTVKRRLEIGKKKELSLVAQLDKMYEHQLNLESIRMENERLIEIELAKQKKELAIEMEHMKLNNTADELKYGLVVDHMAKKNDATKRIALEYNKGLSERKTVVEIGAEMMERHVKQFEQEIYDNMTF